MAAHLIIDYADPYYKPERAKDGNDMRKAVTKLGGIFVPVILCAARIKNYENAVFKQSGRMIFIRLIFL